MLCPICNKPMECKSELWICKNCPEFANGWTMKDFESLHREDVMCIMLGTERPIDKMRRLRENG